MSSGDNDKAIPSEKNADDPWKDYRNNGSFGEGGPPGPGRPKGAVDGIKLLRKLISVHAAEMSITDGELDKMFRTIRRRGDKGALWMLKQIFEPYLRAREAGEVMGGARIHVLILPEKPPPDYQPIALAPPEPSGDGHDRH